MKMSRKNPENTNTDSVGVGLFTLLDGDQSVKMKTLRHSYDSFTQVLTIRVIIKLLSIHSQRLWQWHVCRVQVDQAVKENSAENPVIISMRHNHRDSLTNNHRQRKISLSLLDLRNRNGNGVSLIAVSL